MSGVHGPEAYPEGMRAFPVWLLLGGAMLAQQPSQPHAHPGHSAEHYAKTLEDPARDEWQRPHEVITALGLTGGETVVDLGAGTGYFSRRLARHAGRVLAVDVDAKLLDILRGNAPANVTPILASLDDPRLPDASADLIFICNVLHHIDHRAAYLPKLVRAMKPGGRLVLVDFVKRETPVGPALQYRLSAGEAAAEFAAAGLRRSSRTLPELPYQYMVEFIKP